MHSNITTATALPPTVLSPVGKALEEISASFDRFCLAAGIEALGEMMEKDAAGHSDRAIREPKPPRLIAGATRGATPCTPKQLAKPRQICLIGGIRSENRIGLMATAKQLKAAI